MHERNFNWYKINTKVRFGVSIWFSGNEFVSWKIFSTSKLGLQEKLRNAETNTTALVPLNYKPDNFVSEAKLTCNHRLNIVKAALDKRKEYSTIKESDSDFLDLYNTGLYLPKAYEFLGSISIGTLRRWIQKYKKYENADCLLPQYKITKQGEYNSILNDETKNILLKLLLLLPQN